MGTEFTPNESTMCTKADATLNCFEKVSNLLQECSIPHIERVEGEDVVRVPCRTHDQLDTFPDILHKLIDTACVQTVAFPMDWQSNKKSIVYFIKADKSRVTEVLDAYKGFHVKKVHKDDVKETQKKAKPCLGSGAKPSVVIGTFQYSVYFWSQAEQTFVSYDIYY